MISNSISNRLLYFCRGIGVLFFAITLIMVLWLGKQDHMTGSYLPEERVELIDWAGILADLGYLMPENEMNNLSDNKTKLNLHARAAVLIDGSTGRVLYGKEEQSEYPMASTTKIMTCIVALENGNLSDSVHVSSYAASQPEVKLGIRSGEKYKLKDLLYATMLTSYNDCAVAIAEHIGGSAEGFARMMNQKAAELGCHSTWFITANGLDAKNDGGEHRTTAADLASILAYAIKNETFLEITGTNTYSFAEETGKRNFTAINKNQFLSMMDGVISGKTGYTNDAGYCYAGALENDGRIYVAVVLGSGWPPNKSWKWADTKALMSYGLSHYSLIEAGQKDLVTKARVPVINGIKKSAIISLEWQSKKVLAGEWEGFIAKIQMPEQIEAPLPKGAVIGNVQICLENEPVLFLPVILEEAVEAFTYKFCVEHIFARFFDILIKV